MERDQYMPMQRQEIDIVDGRLVYITPDLIEKRRQAREWRPTVYPMPQDIYHAKGRKDGKYQ